MMPHLRQSFQILGPEHRWSLSWSIITYLGSPRRPQHSDQTSKQSEREYRGGYGCHISKGKENHHCDNNGQQHLPVSQSQGAARDLRVPCESIKEQRPASGPVLSPPPPRRLAFLTRKENPPQAYGPQTRPGGPPQINGRETPRTSFARRRRTGSSRVISDYPINYHW